MTKINECLSTVGARNQGFFLNWMYSLMRFASPFSFKCLSTEKTTIQLLIRMSWFAFCHMFKTFKSLATKITYKISVHDLSLLVLNIQSHRQQMSGISKLDNLISTLLEQRRNWSISWYFDTLSLVVLSLSWNYHSFDNVAQLRRARKHDKIQTRLP